MLLEQIKSSITQNQKNQEDVEELEQYGRRFCLQIDGVPTEEKETSEDVLQKVGSLCSDAKINIPGMAYNWAHRIGKAYNDKGTNKICKSIIVHFSTFRHQTMVYRSKTKISKNARIKVDLTKKRFTLLSHANEYVRNTSLVKFCYTDINCRFKIKWSDEICKDTFFKNMEDLKCLIGEDI